MKNKVVLSLIASGLFYATSVFAQVQWAGVFYSAQQQTPRITVTFNFQGEEVTKQIPAATDDSAHFGFSLAGKSDTNVTVTSSSDETLAQGVITAKGVQCVMTNTKGPNPPLQGITVAYAPGNTNVIVQYNAKDCGAN